MPITGSAPSSRLGVRKKSSFLQIEKRKEENGGDCANSGEEIEEGVVHWWEAKSAAIAKWFRSNPLNLGISSESAELIQQQLKRGSTLGASEDTKVKCWAHIAIEFEGVPGSPVHNAAVFGALQSLVADATVVSPRPETEEPASAPSSAVKVLASPAPSPEPPFPFDCEDAAVPRSDAPANSPPRKSFQDQLDVASKILKEEGGEKVAASAVPVKTKSLSKMSMLERQQYFMEKKREKQRAERERRQKEEEMEELLAAKKRDEEKQKRRSFSRRMSSTDASNKNDESKARRASLIDECKALVSSASSKQTFRSGDSAHLTKSRLSEDTKPTKAKVVIAKRRKSASSLPPRRRSSKQKKTVKSSSALSLLEQCQATIQVSASVSRAAEETKEHEIESCEKEAEDAPKSPEEIKETIKGTIPKADEPGTKGDASATVNAELPETNDAVDAPPLSPKHKFAPNSTQDKGVIKVQEAELFEMDSFYRKRDRGTSQRGVTLLMGRREDSGRESVVSIYFDRRMFTELSASEWFESNVHRFH